MQQSNIDNNIIDNIDDNNTLSGERIIDNNVELAAYMELYH